MSLAQHVPIPGGRTEPISAARLHAFFPSKAAGIFYCGDFPLSPDVEPWWVPINDGLTSLNIRQFCPDYTDPVNRQYCITTEDSNAGRVYRRENGTWSAVLTYAKARELTNGNNGAIIWVTANQITPDHVYVLYNNTLAGGAIWCLRSENRGDSWTAHAIYPGIFNYGAFNIAARGSVLYFGGSFAIGNYGKVCCSLDDGVTWPNVAGFGSVGPVVYIDPTDTSVAWATESGRSNNLVKLTNYAQNTSVPPAAVGLGGGTVPSLWITTGLHRRVHSDSVHKSADEWQTKDTGPATGYGVDQLDVESEMGSVLLARTSSGSLGSPHTLYVTTDEGQTMTPRSGADPGGAGSIPYDCGGCAPGGPYTYWEPARWLDYARLYRGAGRFLIAETDIEFPSRFEDVMNPDTYALASGWMDAGATSADGIRITRTTDLDDGIRADQRKASFGGGDPIAWEMAVETQFVESAEQQLERLLGEDAQLGRLSLDANVCAREWRVACVQEDVRRGFLRVFVFRSGRVSLASALVFRSRHAEYVPVRFTLSADPTVSEGAGQFGKVFEME